MKDATRQQTARGAILLLALSLGCGGNGDAPRAAPARERGSAVVGGRVASTVDGQAITRSDVAHAARIGGVAPELALARLEDEALLAGAAERAGFGDDAEVERAARRAAVQALLARDIEREITADAIDETSLEAAYAASHERFARPERRRSVHVLARVPEGAPAALADAAEAWIRARYAELRDADDPEAALLALRHRPPSDLPFEITIEEVPPLARVDSADPSYLAALFARAETGLASEPVRSTFGWHALVVTEIVPAWRATHDEAIAMLRDERLAALRAARLEERLRELASSTPVAVNEALAQRVFRTLGEGE